MLSRIISTLEIETNPIYKKYTVSIPLDQIMQENDRNIDIAKFSARDI